MTITIINNHNGEIYELTPAKGSAKSAFKDLYSYARTIDRCDHKADTDTATDLLVAMFRNFTISVQS